MTTGVFFTGKTERYHPTFIFPSGFDMWHIPNHWVNEETTFRFIENIIPYIEDVRNYQGTLEQHALVIFSAFRTALIYFSLSI